MEWFDFGVYGFLVVTIGQVFLPFGSDTTSLIASYLVFAAAFLGRPLGGMFFGPLGDRIGRKRVLIMTIVLMSVATFVIGVLPGYGTIGIWAAVCLIILRLVQGFATGGEYGGAATLIVESAPDKRRGFLSSWLEFGTLLGFASGAAAVTVLTFFLSSEAMHDWGWRVPFLCALPLGLIGLFIRLKVQETPSFENMEGAREAPKSSLREIFVNHWRPLLQCIGIVILLNVADYTFLTYMPSYLNKQLGLGEQAGRLILIGIMVCMMIVITPLGALSDKVGRKPLLIASSLGFIALSWPAFFLMTHFGVGSTAVGLAIIGVLLVLLLATLPSTLPTIFPTRIRYGGFAVSYNISTMFFGGTAPTVIVALVASTGNNYMPGFYLMLVGVVALVPILLLRETACQPLP